MGTNCIVGPATESEDMVHLTPVSLVPGPTNHIQNPNLGDAENDPPQNLDFSDLGCHDAPTQIPKTSFTSAAIFAPVPPLSDVVDQSSVDIDGMSGEDHTVIEDTHEEQQEAQGLEIAEQAANEEWQRQHTKFHENRGIHHFNFLGDGIVCKNATPPAVSLFVAVTGAKAGFVDMAGEYDPHGYAVMRNAMKLVDPIIYHGPCENLYLRGEPLRRAATGLCEKFYSEHGTWQNDRYQEDEDLPSLDKMEVGNYPLNSLPVNGWFQSGFVLDRWDLHAHCHTLHRHHHHLRRKRREAQDACKRKASLLRHMTTAEDVHPSPKEERETPEGTTAVKNKGGAKRFDCSWTVNLDAFLGKCDNWADEVDDLDKKHAEVTPAGSSNDSSASHVQSGALDGSQTEPGPASASVSDPIVAPQPSRPLPGLILTNEESIGEDDESNELPPAPAVAQSRPVDNLFERTTEGLTEAEVEAEDREIYGDAPPASENLSLLPILEKRHAPVDERASVSSISSGSVSSAMSSNFALPIRQKPPTVLATVTDSPSLATESRFCLPTGQNRHSSTEGPQIVSATTCDPISVAMSSSLMLPIRRKRPAPLPDFQTVPSNTPDSSSLEASSSFSLPTRAKLPGSAIVPKNGVTDPSADRYHDGQIAPFSSAHTTNHNHPVRSLTPPLQTSQSVMENEDEADTNEKMSPIPLEALSSAVMSPRPRKPRARRLAESSSDLIRVSLDGWPEADAQDDVEQSPSKRAAKSEITSLGPRAEAFESIAVTPGNMVEKFKDAPIAPIKKHPGIPAFDSLVGPKLGAARKASPPTPPPRSPLRSWSKLARTPEPLLPQPRVRNELNKLEEITEGEAPRASVLKSSEEMLRAGSNRPAHKRSLRNHRQDASDRSESDEQHGESVANLPARPADWAYEHMAPNTSRKLMAKDVRSDLQKNLDSDKSSKEAEAAEWADIPSAIADIEVDTSCYAIDNWSKIFGPDESVDFAQQTSVNVDEIPVPGDLPLTDRCITVADSSVRSNVGSSNSSTPVPTTTTTTTTATTSTGATTPSSVEPPKTVKDVEFVPIRPRKSTWRKIREKLGSLGPESSAPEPRPRPPKKAKFGKAARKFLRRRLEDLGMVAQVSC